MNSANLINQTSGDVEIYTPQRIVDAAREAMGGQIDLDPASSAIANRTVLARRFFNEADDGLKQNWSCDTLWMNHPFHAGWKACGEHCQRKSCAKRGYHIFHDIPSNSEWIRKLIDSYELGLIREAACCITFASTSEEWFRPLLDWPQCYLWPRTNYIRPDGSVYRGVTKGSVVTYFGEDKLVFEAAFDGLGTVKS